MTLKATGRSMGLVLLLCTACTPPLATLEPDSPISTAANSAAASGSDLATPGEAVSGTPDALVAAVVNGDPVYLAEYERKLGQYEASLLPDQGIDPASPEGQERLAWARTYILDAMIEQVMTEQAATEVGVTISDEEVDAYVASMIEEVGGEDVFDDTLAARGETREDAWQEVRTQLIGMAMAQRVLEAVPAVAEHVHARHILVDTLEEAERIHAQLEAGADFAALAQEYSQDPNTRDTGGDLGFFPRGILTAPEVEEAAFALQPGQFSGVVASVLGYHIVQVVERDRGRAVSPENLSLLQARMLHEWTEGLWSQAVIQRFVETVP